MRPPLNDNQPMTPEGREAWGSVYRYRIQVEAMTQAVARMEAEAAQRDLMEKLSTIGRA